MWRPVRGAHCGSAVLLYSIMTYYLQATQTLKGGHGDCCLYVCSSVGAADTDVSEVCYRLQVLGVEIESVLSGETHSADVNQGYAYFYFCHFEEEAGCFTCCRCGYPQNSRASLML